MVDSPLESVMAQVWPTSEAGAEAAAKFFISRPASKTMAVNSAASDIQGMKRCVFIGLRALVLRLPPCNCWNAAGNYQGARAEAIVLGEGHVERVCRF